MKKKRYGWIGFLVTAILLVTAAVVFTEKFLKKNKTPRRYINGGMFDIYDA